MFQSINKHLQFPGIHYMYYKLQANENLIPKNERQELFYIRWLKERIPALKGIGNQDWSILRVHSSMHLVLLSTVCEL